MADRNQLRIDRDYGFAESDPLAELTRIMGFDPRIEPAPPMDDDLGIDLERELMGEFEADLRDEAAEQPEAANDQPAAVDFPAFEAEPDVGDFDAALAASLDEEFSLEASQWQAEMAQNPVSGRALETETHPGEAGVNAAVAVDMDFSGQLSVAPNEPAAMAELALADEETVDHIPDLEAELGELLDALGAPRHGLAAAVTEEGDAWDNPAPATEIDSEGMSPNAGTGLASDELAEPVYEAADDYNPALPDGGAEMVEADAAEAYSVDHADEYGDRYGSAVPHAQIEPRDEILDQLFGSAASSREVTDAGQDELASSEGIQGSEIDFFADTDQKPAAESFDGALNGHAWQPEDPGAHAEVYAGSVEDIDGPAAVVAMPEAEELLFDESEFEAAMAGEIETMGETADAAEEPRSDPFAALSSMGLPMAVTAVDADADQADGESVADDDDGDFAAYEDAPPAAVSHAPDIDTVEVPEQAVALADDLNIPEVRFESDAAVDFDDLDSEFSSSFSELNAPAHDVRDAVDLPVETTDFEADFDRLFEVGDADDVSNDSGYTADAAIAAEADAYASARYGAPARDYHPAQATNQPAASATGLEADGGDALVYDPAYDGQLENPPLLPDGEAPRNRGFMIAAVVAGLAFAGGAGAIAFSFGGGEDSAPALVKADNGPVKIRPENPGGAVVPNQDSKVYERVSGGPLEAPSQEKLISGAEEPVELATRGVEAVTPQGPSAEDLPGVDLAPIEAAPAAELALPKAEDRIEASPDIESVIANEEVAAVAPRRVRTMIVRPDGTLVPREDPAPAAAVPAVPQQPQPGSEAGVLEQPAAPAPALAPISAEPGEAVAQPAVINQGPAATASPAVLPAAGQPASSAPSVAAPAAENEPATPARVPVAPSRPGDQPVEIVGEVRTRAKLAALAAPEPAAPAATSSWSMQIASQPTAEGAQSTYVNLARRYGSVLGGRSFNIVKADIAGKGTYYRVRIPAESRADAIDLCERYKGAGGSCFVSQ